MLNSPKVISLAISEILTVIFFLEFTTVENMTTACILKFHHKDSPFVEDLIVAQKNRPQE
jgi:hypothetical protein